MGNRFAAFQWDRPFLELLQSLRDEITLLKNDRICETNMCRLPMPKRKHCNSSLKEWKGSEWLISVDFSGNAA